MTLHAIIINKQIANSKEEARNIAKKFFPKELKNKSFVRETKQSFRVRITPKTKFNYSTFKSFKPNPYITIIYGSLK
jgi:hypothetical protein